MSPSAVSRSRLEGEALRGADPWNDAVRYFDRLRLACRANLLFDEARQRSEALSVRPVDLGRRRW